MRNFLWLWLARWAEILDGVIGVVTFTRCYPGLATNVLVRMTEWQMDRFGKEASDEQ